MISLNGLWNYILDQDSKYSYQNIAHRVSKRNFDGKMKIPDNWQTGGLHNYSGTVWFIRYFNIKKNKSKHFILRFYGVDYFCEVWINNRYVGKHEGYFQNFEFEITREIKSKNLLVVKVTSPKEPVGTVWPNKKKLIKGIFNHHDCRPGGWDLNKGQDLNTGGIWNNVELLNSSKLVIKNAKITTLLNKDFSEASVDIELKFSYDIQTKRKNVFVGFEIVAPGKNKIVHYVEFLLHPRKIKQKFTISLSSPVLWYPYDLGKPALYKLKVVSDVIEVAEYTFGIRQIDFDKSQNFYINGKKLFLRGTNLIPTLFLGELNRLRIKKIIKLLKDSNINIVRIHAHVNRRELYEEFDKHGLLVWQDFSLQWTYDESERFTRNAVRQITEMVEQLYNHPSIVFWCCHNEPGEQMNTLDIKLYRRVKRIDKSRIIRIASNYEEHAYDGWYWGKPENFIAAPMGPLVTEFGAQAIPALDSLKKFIPEDKIFPPDLNVWEYHNFQPDQTFNIAKVKTGKSIQQFIENSQQYQYRLLEKAVHYYRRRKNRDITGLFQFMFIDSWPSITWSVVDYYLKKKKGYYALQKSFKPLLLSTELLQDQYFPGSKLNLDIWVINDLYREYEKLKIVILLGNVEVYNKNNINIKENGILRIHNAEIEAFIPNNMIGQYILEIKLLKRKKVVDSNNFAIKIVPEKFVEIIDE